MPTLERTEVMQVTFEHVTFNLPNEAGEVLQSIPNKEDFFIQAVLNELRRRKNIVYRDPKAEYNMLEVDDMHPELLAKYERGKADIEAGRTTPHSQMKIVFADLKQKLQEKMKAENGN